MRNHQVGAAVVASLLVGVVALSACGKGDPNTPEYWVKQLQDRKARELTLREIRKDRLEVHIDGLLVLLKEEGAHRPDVVQMLAQITEKFPAQRDRVGPAMGEVVDYAVSATSDKTARAKNLTNQRVCEAFGRLGYAAGADVAVRLLDSKDNSVRLAAVTALGKLRAKSAADKLIQIVEEDENNFMVKNAIIALGNLAEDKAVPALVNKMFFERAVSFYRESSYSLFQIGKASVQPLLELLEGKGDYLAKIAVKPNPWIVKAKCLEVLSDIADARAVKPIMAVLTAADSGDPFQKIAQAKAASAAGRMGLKEAAPTLRKMAMEIDVTQAEYPLEALRLIGDRAAAPELLRGGSREGYYAQCKQEFDEEACKNSEMEIRTKRLSAGTQLATAGDLPTMEKMEAAEKDAKLKEMVGKHKARLVAAKECGDKVPCWIGKLKDPVPAVRDKAAFELLWAKNAEATEPLLAALRDDDLDARFAIVMSLMRNLPPTSGADSVLKIIQEEEGKVQFIKINEDLKRLEVKMRRGY
jgi:HEAT repeat protein